MRRNTKGFRPQLEMLEERWVPATVHDVAGDLLVSKQTGTSLTVAVTGVGQVKVTDGSGSVTYSNVGSLIEITATNLADTITFTGNAADYSGNLLVLGGNGGDTVNLTGITNGNVIVETGLGKDTLNLSGTIGGNLSYDDTYGNDTVNTAAATTVSGSATLTGLQKLTLTHPLTVGGSLTLTNLSAGFPLTVTGASTGTLTVGSTSGPLGSLTVTGGAGADVFDPSGLVNVSGNVSFNFTQSVGTSGFALPEVGATGSSVGGNLTYNGGNGENFLILETNDTFAGNVSLYGGNGTNVFDLVEAWSVAGNLVIAGGNGTNAVDIGLATTPAVVAGNLTITLGNGANTVEVFAPPAGLFTYHGGNGTNAVLLDGAASLVYDVYLTFGTGINALEFDSGNNGLIYTGTVIGSGGTNAFAQSASDTLIDISFINFP